jgi:hypothetical protein
MFTQLQIYVLGTLLILVLSLGYGVHHFRSALETEKIAYAVLESASENYLNIIKDNAKIIDKNAAEAKVREEEGRILILNSQKKFRQHQSTAQSILATLTTNVDQCKSAEILLNNYISSQHK